MFLLFKGMKTEQNMITGISVLGFFGPQMAVSLRKSVFSKIGLLKPLFYSVLGGARSLGQVVTKGTFWTPPPKKKKIG